MGLRSKTKKETDRIETASYYLFCEIMWRRSGALVNLLFCFVLSFSTDVPNKRYRDSKTLNTNVGCIGFYLTLWSLVGISLLNTFLLLIWRFFNWLWCKGPVKIGEVLWGKVSYIGVAMAWNMGIPRKFLESLTTTY